MPHTAGVVDDVCIVRSVFTEAINHDPAITFFQTGSQQPGRPSMGAWLSYGLGSLEQKLPEFIVFISGGSPGDQPLFERLWGAGFLPAKHQGVRFRAGADPVLYLSDPPGVSRRMRRRMLDGLAQLNRLQHDEFGDPALNPSTGAFTLLVDGIATNIAVDPVTRLGSSGVRSLSSETNIQFFRFRAQGTGLSFITVNVGVPFGLPDSAVRLYNLSGTQIGFNELNSAYSRLLSQLTGGQDYFVVVEKLCS